MINNFSHKLYFISFQHSTFFFIFRVMCVMIWWILTLAKPSNSDGYATRNGRCYRKCIIRHFVLRSFGKRIMKCWDHKAAIMRWKGRIKNDSKCLLSRERKKRRNMKNYFEWVHLKCNKTRLYRAVSPFCTLIDIKFQNFMHSNLNLLLKVFFLLSFLLFR